jgi:hypothetical protein
VPHQLRSLQPHGSQDAGRGAAVRAAGHWWAAALLPAALVAALAGLLGPQCVQQHICTTEHAAAASEPRSVAMLTRAPAFSQVAVDE